MLACKAHTDERFGLWHLCGHCLTMVPKIELTPVQHTIARTSSLGSSAFYTCRPRHWPMESSHVSIHCGGKTSNSSTFLLGLSEKPGTDEAISDRQSARRRRADRDWGLEWADGASQQLCMEMILRLQSRQATANVLVMHHKCDKFHHIGCALSISSKLQHCNESAAKVGK